jgi:hypothetical protein
MSNNGNQPLTRGNRESWLNTIWSAIECETPTEDSDDINTAMAWIREELGMEDEVEQENKKLYRVELVDYIGAESEHQAIDIFTQVMADVCVSDDAFDVYEVDQNYNRKEVK